MANKLPLTNRCQKCGEWFHNAHACMVDLEVALAKCCGHCNDGDGLCIFPYYGVAPHTHDNSEGWIGSTRTLPREQWGDNFREDPDVEGHGVFMRCEHCGNGEKKTPNV